MRLPIIIYCDKPSAGAAALAEALPAYRAGPEGFRSRAGERVFRRREHLLINWGCTQGDIVAAHGEHGVGVVGNNLSDVLNFTQCVARATSKFDTCKTLESNGVPTLEVTHDVAEAQRWIDDGKIVLGRKDGLTNGAGILKLQAETITTVQQASIHFYSKYFKKTHEFRFHVFKDEVIDIQQKRRSRDRDEEYDPMIRSHDRGWTFCRELSIGTPEELELMKQTAIRAVDVLGLDFGAVDMLARFNDRRVLKAHAVCEINTRPGLEGTTVTKYAEAIRSLLQQ